ncbi:xanthine phosphoribosyltransferase [Vagococcus lutrae]|uniref:Xanthine phosphoribosyltransferase n=1 Tax=Vagococcus lutrae LBD1 TaxID=1408226 RepID=V6Q3I2_9ENTE|nr:xanthine phosphoribosyltransferase [Vagococcus lutrae]EST89674.1 xanthine phosphoribosyltransferase [Vagococcus lutrae LBD1]MCO7151697.1 xanthine phosphoribosyltransferase [Vagococcus lutrae]MDT2805974.1 xanthine phosphoribosyltransferase [Vagococcus lutrae]MDT2813075.1 xanthine phosphoribosyltransferase [Vagococcus lutrae]MDT2816686.1 xanthine phosphoribosyltransferase [Vagococcus lutrae]
MKQLQEKILKEGTVLGQGVLKVDRFLTHQVDPQLMAAIGQDFANYFAEEKITKVVTLEASGITPAVFTALSLDVPMIYARKSKSLTLSDELLTSSVYSFTKQVTSDISISRHLLTEEDTVLIIDDFLANGQAAKGLIELCQQAGANVAGLGIVIEKSFQSGRQLLEDAGIHVYSQARIASLDNGEITFVEKETIHG